MLLKGNPKGAGVKAGPLRIDMVMIVKDLKIA